MRKSASSAAARMPASLPGPRSAAAPRAPPAAREEPRAPGRALAVLAATVGAALLLAVAQRVRPLPFGTTDDGPMYFAPLIELQTRALLSGHWPRMFWELGSGWTPFESGQVGVAYPGYLVAAVIARVAGHPLALLDVSAWLHLWVAGLACALLLPGNVGGPRRAAFALLAVAQPGPFLLGLNWHDYLACYPWFLASGLILLRNLSRDERWPLGEELGLVLASAAFWMTAHPQMYAVGIACLGAWVLALRPERPWRALAALALAQLPLAAPTLFLHDASTRATANWMFGRGTDEFAMRWGQTLGTVASGLLSGNLLGEGGFRLWPGVPSSGQGMFFAPWLLWSWVLAIRTRRNLWIVLSAALAGLLAIATFPSLVRLVPAALGLRWTWKLSLFLGPLALLAVVRLHDRGGRSRRALEPWGVVALALVAAAVCVRGVRFDIWPGLKVAHPLGLERVVEVTRDALQRAGAERGSRIAIVGKYLFDQDLPVPVVGLTGDAPVLSGYESAHLYEPLENAQAAASHDNLSTPWRMRVEADAYRRDPAAVETRLASLGVDFIVTAAPGIFPRDGTVDVPDPLGRVTSIRRIRGAPPSFPYDVARDDAVERLPGGGLRTLSAAPAAPTLNVPRAMTWKRLVDGRWEGTPVVVEQPWLLRGALGLCVAALGLAWGRGRRTRSTRARSP